MKKTVELLKDELFTLICGVLFFAVALVYAASQIEITSIVFYSIALLFCGLPVFISAIKGILRRDLLDEKFLMSIASIGAIVIGDMTEGVAVMLFFRIGEFFEHKAVAKSRKSIKSLMQIRPDKATVVCDGEESVVDSDDVEIGTQIVIKSGERVPIDAVVISGSADLDTSALTGESIPRAVLAGEHISSGSIVIGGVLYCVTEREAEKSSAQRILELVENATENKSKEESFITVFSRIYTPVVVGIAVILAIFLPLIFKSVSYSESIYRALSFLVISCPCALVISVPMAFFGGIGGAAAKGILFKGGSAFSPLAKADVFAFDKTGTLTSGKLAVRDVRCFDFDKNELIYLAASAEYGSNHPISLAISDMSSAHAYPEKVTEESGKGVYAVIENKRVLVGNATLLKEHNVDVPQSSDNCGVFVAVNGRCVGEIILSDTVKSEARDAVKSLKELGAKEVVMLSGDKRETAERVAREIGIDAVCGELLPQDKFDKLQELKKRSKSAVFVGDGINDSPCIASADAGIAMGGIGSDSAIEAADVVIMSDNLNSIPTARRIARKTLSIAKQNIVFALAVKISILILSSFGMGNMWLAVFADVGVAVLAISNSMRAMIVGKRK